MKNDIILLYLVLFIFSLPSCGLISFIKMNKLEKQGKIMQEFFKKEISFKEINGKIIIPVTLYGKQYDFLFDTGAPTVIDDDLAKILNLKSVGSSKVNDANGKKKELSHVQLNNISIQNIDFVSILTLVSDMSLLETNGCVNVSGIVGANIMNKAVWQIDYLQKKIIFTNHIDSLHIPAQSNSILFSPTLQGTPRFHLQTSSGISTNVILDTGSSGGIAISKKNLQFIEPTAKTVKGYGLNTAAFGEVLDTTIYTLLPDISLGYQFDVKDKVVAFEHNVNSGTVGHAFLKNYLLTIDWKYEKITFSPTEVPQKSVFKSYGFNFKLNKNQFIISSIYEGSFAYNVGINLGQRIIAINNKNYENATHEDFCDLMMMMKYKEDDLEVQVEKDNQIVTHTIKKVDLTKTLLAHDN